MDNRKKTWWHILCIILNYKNLQFKQFFNDINIDIYIALLTKKKKTIDI